MKMTYYFIILYFLFILIPSHLNKTFKKVSQEKKEIDFLDNNKNASKNNETEDLYMNDKKDKDKEDNKNDDKNDDENHDNYIPESEHKNDTVKPERKDDDIKDNPAGRRNKDDITDETEEVEEEEEADDNNNNVWNWLLPENIKNLTSYYINLKNEIENLNYEITKYKIYIIFNAFIAGVLFLIIVLYCSIKCFLLCIKRREEDYNLNYLTDKLGELYIDDVEEEKPKKKTKFEDYDDAPSSANSKNKKKKNITFNPDNYKSSDEDKLLYKPYKNEDIQ